MVRITKRGITEELDGLFLNRLLKEIKHINKKEDLIKFFNQYLTAEEQIMIKKRLAILLFLKEGKRPKDIQEGLDVSRTTISFVRRGLTKLPKKERKPRKITKEDYKPDRKTSRFPAYRYMPGSGKGRWKFLNR